MFVMSSSGVLGRYIDLPPPVTIWIRCLIATAALFIILKLLKRPAYIGWGRHFRIILISSIFLGGHWITYFMALQLSNVAIAMLSMFTYPVITALLEPVMLKTKFDSMTLILSIVAFIGIFFLVPELSFNNSVTQGVSLGVLAGFFYAIRNILMKKNLVVHGGITLMYYQVFLLSILLIPVIFIYDIDIPKRVLGGEWQPLLILAIATTAIGHTLFVRSLKYFTVSTVSIMSCLTPLLGTFLAFLFLEEVPTGQTFIAGSIILLTAGYESVRSVKQKV